MTSTFTLSHNLESAADTARATTRFALFRSIEAAGSDWDAAAPASDIFLQRSFLRVVEENPPKRMRLAYLVFYKGDTPVGVGLCQIKYFKGDDNIADLQVQGKDPCFFNSLASWFKKWVAGKAAADILILGNMLVTGEHGYHFDYQKISEKEATEILEQALDKVVEILGREGVKMPVTLIKDVAPQSYEQRHYFLKKGYTEFDIQPNMVMDLDYPDMEAYLAAMTTKYRTRAKRAFKKLDGIERRELSLQEIQQELPTIYRLYKDIANNAGFNMVDLNEQYLPALKHEFKSQFRMFGYYLDGKMLAFYTTIQNGEELEAHFLGYEKNYNHDYQLYLNILYDIVQIGIASKCARIIFARTALEIKSSVGATAHHLFCYLKHHNHLANKFVPSLLDYLKPVEEWQPRHPFKEEE